MHLYNTTHYMSFLCFVVLLFTCSLLASAGDETASVMTTATDDTVDSGVHEEGNI